MSGAMGAVDDPWLFPAIGVIAVWALMVVVVVIAKCRR